MSAWRGPLNARTIPSNAGTHMDRTNVFVKKDCTGLTTNVKVSSI